MASLPEIKDVIYSASLLLITNLHINCRLYRHLAYLFFGACTRLHIRRYVGPSAGRSFGHFTLINVGRFGLPCITEHAHPSY